MKIKNRLVIITFITALLILLPVFVLSDCPKTEYRPNDLRADLRAIILNFLSAPDSSDYTLEEIIDLLNFYNKEKGKDLIGNCDISLADDGSIEVQPRGKSISNLLKKTIEFQEKCSDGTPYGLCSINKPLYCGAGNLANNCQRCGCPVGQVCLGEKGCVVGSINYPWE
ncbi:MAG: hypothetical protein Q8R04_00420, partial [Nanoarchaeota archaeon]|nr:hypothetical protein [Nanoarchaeota archaeon]